MEVSVRDSDISLSLSGLPNQVEYQNRKVTVTASTGATTIRKLGRFFCLLNGWD